VVLRTSYGDHVWLTVLLALWVFVVGFVRNIGPYSYAGIVGCFTAPIIALGYSTKNHSTIAEYTLARIELTCIGGFIWFLTCFFIRPNLKKGYLWDRHEQPNKCRSAVHEAIAALSTEMTQLMQAKAEDDHKALEGLSALSKTVVDHLKVANSAIPAAEVEGLLGFHKPFESAIWTALVKDIAALQASIDRYSSAVVNKEFTESAKIKTDPVCLGYECAPERPVFNKLLSNMQGGLSEAAKAIDAGIQEFFHEEETERLVATGEVEKARKEVQEAMTQMMIERTGRAADEVQANNSVQASFCLMALSYNEMADAVMQIMKHVADMLTQL